jgi:hypothetical protein
MVDEPIGGTAMPEKGDASREEVKELTDQFYVTLRAYVARLDKEDESRSPKSFKQIEDLRQAAALHRDPPSARLPFHRPTLVLLAEDAIVGRRAVDDRSLASPSASGRP